MNLEHFYFVPNSKPNVLSRSQGITPTQVAECQHLAPLPLSEGAAGLFRGETTDYILGISTASAIHYVFLPADILAECAWNLRVLRLTETPTPPDLPLLALRGLQPPTTEEQIQALQPLMLFSAAVIDGLSAAHIQDMPIAILNCPAEQRIALVQALLYLLPAPARALTFATHADEKTPAQIKFMNSAPANHLIFDWQQKALLNPAPQEAYSRYMVTLLQADPAQVVQQTAQFARTANWERLSEGRPGLLTWLARRARIDQALQANQAVNPKQVSAILYNDPTLPADLRWQYSQYLLTAALQDDLSAADVLPSIAAGNPEIGNALARAVREIAPPQAIRLLGHWLANAPKANALPWDQLLHQLTGQQVNQLLQDNDFAGIASFLNQVHLPENTAANVLSLLQQPAFYQPALAQAVLGMAARSLPLSELDQLLNEPRFTRQLPDALQNAIRSGDNFAGAVSAFPEVVRPLLLSRLAEWSLGRGKSSGIDTGMLQALLGGNDIDLINRTVNELSRLDQLTRLDHTARRTLIQLVLKTRRYEDAIALVAAFQGQAEIRDVARLAGEAYWQAPLTSTELDEAVSLLENSKILPEVRALIYCGALKNQQWDDSQLRAAHRLTELIFNSPNVVPMIGFQNTTDLLDFHGRRQDSESTLKVAVGIVANALEMGTRGATLLVKIWESITFEPRIARSAMELLRRYIRGVNAEDAQKLPTYFGKELGAEVAANLQATYYMRQVVENADLLGFFAELHTLTGMLVYLHRLFKNPMPHTQLERGLSGMTASLSPEDRQQLGTALQQVAQLIAGQPRSKKRDPYLRLEVVPTNGIDLLYFMAGHFSQGQAAEPNIDQVRTNFALAGRSLLSFLQEAQAVQHFLGGLQAVPAKHTVKPEALTAELESLWRGLSDTDQQAVRGTLVEDCYVLATLLGTMADQADNRATRQIELNQRQPVTPLEALRWMSGYFLRG